MALGLGANLGAAESTLRLAIARLEQALGPLAAAPLYRTRPHSPEPQPDFLNTAVLGTSDLPPDAILAVAKRLEMLAGRGPARRHGPRALDLDLLLYGDLVLSHPELTLPHPRLGRRRFVLAPLADLAPDLAVPPGGVTVAELLARVGQEAEVERIGWSGPAPPRRRAGCVDGGSGAGP